MNMEQWWNDGWQGKIEESLKKPARLPFRSLRISQEVIED
jgi:hypothetical protein